MPEASATVPVLAPKGELELNTSRELGLQLAELAGVPGDAVLDLSELTFMDSVGLAVVIKAVQRFSRQDKLLVLVVPPDGNVARLFEFAGVRDRFRAVPTRDEALEIAGRAR